MEYSLTGGLKGDSDLASCLNPYSNGILSDYSIADIDSYEDLS